MNRREQEENKIENNLGETGKKYIPPRGGEKRKGCKREGFSSMSARPDRTGAHLSANYRRPAPSLGPEKRKNIPEAPSVVKV